MLSITNPYDLKEIRQLPLASASELEKVLQKARQLSIDHPLGLPAHQRIAVLRKTAALMEGRMDELAWIVAQEGGKPLMDSMVEVKRAINGVQIAAEQIAQLKGEQVPMGLTEASEGRVAFSTKEPIGVVAAISAFNHPLNLIVHQAATAVAAGCPVIVKPALNTPLSCLEFVHILHEAGQPEGWCQVLICEDELAEQLATDPRVNYLSFIGSAKVGWYLRSKLAPGTRCGLEHGGAAPVIVEPDADIDALIPALAKGGFYHAGQVCVSVQRVFVHDSIADRVADRLAKRATLLKVGDPLDPETEVGPLISPEEVDRVESWVNEAVEAGAELLIGGERISDTCYAPTVLLNPPMNAKVSTKEVFGPVVCIYAYRVLEEAISWANELDMHFQASVFTQHISKALECAKAVNATAVMINDHTAFRVDWMPFGGRDVSGLGLGGIPYAMQEMSRDKLVVIKH